MDELKEPKEKLSKINELLDKLDVKLAQGEITEAKYRELCEKYKAEADSLKNLITEKELMQEVGLGAAEKEEGEYPEEETGKTEPEYGDDEESLVYNLRRLLTEGGAGNYLKVSVGEVYIQFAADRGDQKVYAEAVSNQFLPPSLKLREDKISQLRSLGFEKGRDSPNFSRIFYIVDSMELREIARTTLSILSKVYGVPARSRIQFELVHGSELGEKGYQEEEKKKGSIGSAFLWMLVLSVLIGWVPFLGSLIVGIAGGRNAGSVGKTIQAGILPIIIMFFLSQAVYGKIPTADGAIIVFIAYVVLLIIGAAIGSRTVKNTV